MKITFVNRMMGVKFGGGENFDLNMARALKKRGHEIRFVIGSSPGIPEPVVLDDEFEVIRIRTPYLRRWHYKIRGNGVAKRFLSSLALELDLWLFERKAAGYLSGDRWTQVYQLCGLARLGAWLSTKKESSECATVLRWPGPPSRRKLRFMQRCSINIANGDAYRIIRRDLPVEIRSVNIGVDTEYFTPPVSKTEKGEIRFLFVGRIVPVKNLPMLIAAFKKACAVEKEIYLDIVGTGEEKEIERLRQMIGNESKIRFLGEKRGEELLKAYRKSDVFCLSSSYDNFPNVILEAMACGLPVIATRVGGVPDQVEAGRTGLLVEADHIEGMSRAILELSRNPEQRRTMGRNARKRIEERFSWSSSAEILEQIYREVCQCAES